MTNLRRRCGIALVAVALVVPGSGGCKPGGSHASPSASPSRMSDAQVLALGKELAQCIRDNGVPEFPDPKLENGQLVVPGMDEMDEATKQRGELALEKCRPIMNRIPAAALGRDESGDGRHYATAEDVPKLRKFAECIRNNGVPEWPDPKPDGSFPIGEGSPLITEGKSPRIIGAMQACRQYWDGSITVHN